MGFLSVMESLSKGRSFPEKCLMPDTKAFLTAI